MTSHSNLIFIGLDGLSWELTNLLIQKGIFKNIGRIKNKGCYGDMHSTKPPVTPVAWASFATGKKPEKTGIYEFVLPQKKFGESSVVSTNSMNGKTFYEHLDAAGYRCILINLPLSYPPRIKKTVITSILSRSQDIVFPAELIKKYSVFENYKIEADMTLANKRDYSGFIDEISKIEKTRFEVGKKLFLNEAWDFFLIHFFSTDTLMHELYHILIKDNLSAKEKQLQNKAFSFFKEIDFYVGWFMERIGDNSLFILSDHGFKQYDGLFFANTWLKKKGYLTYLADSKKKSIFFSNRIINLVGQMDNRIFKKIVSAAYALTKSLLGVTYQASNKIANKSRAYCLRYRGIYLNKQQVYSDGILNKDKSNLLRDQLIAELSELRCPTGEKIFKSVLPKEQIYEKPFLSIPPDIYLDVNNFDVAYHNSPYIFNKDIIVNEHDDTGIFLAYGKNIKNTRKNVAIWDFAPTILARYGFGKLELNKMNGKILNIFMNPSNMGVAKEKISLTKSVNDLTI